MSPWAEAQPRRADSTAVTALVLLGAVHCRQRILVFLHEDVLPILLVAVPINFHSVTLLPLLGIVSGFHRHLHEVWVDACPCSACATHCSRICSVRGTHMSVQVLDSGTLVIVLSITELKP